MQMNSSCREPRIGQETYSVPQPRAPGSLQAALSLLVTRVPPVGAPGAVGQAHLTLLSDPSGPCRHFQTCRGSLANTLRGLLTLWAKAGKRAARMRTRVLTSWPRAAPNFLVSNSQLVTAASFPSAGPLPRWDQSFDPRFQAGTGQGTPLTETAAPEITDNCSPRLA